MIGSEASAKAKLWLDCFSKVKVDPVPVFPVDYETLHNLCGITPERVMRNESGKIMVYFISKEPCIRQLKGLYGFFTTTEAAQELKEAANGS